MAPSFLIVGATGNTGRAVVETLSQLLHTNPSLSGYRILALTRSLKSSTSQQLASLPGVEVIEQNWVEITSDWLREREVARVFIAPHNQPNQFAEESTFHLAALRADVQYVVRISTTTANVRPDCDAYYPRQHWAIETMLESSAFEKMQWTSLQPNVFSSFYMSPAAELIKNVRSGGKQGTLSLIANADTPVGIIDANDVGIVAAHLLMQDDTTVHNKAKYTINGPEDITGNQIVAMVEEHIGAKVEHVKFADMSFVEAFVVSSPQESNNVIGSIRYAAQAVWDGLCKADTTSKEVLELAAPSKTPADALEMLLR